MDYELCMLSWIGQARKIIIAYLPCARYL